MCSSPDPTVCYSCLKLSAIPVMVLTGTYSQLDCCNVIFVPMCAVPFDEDEREPSVWFLDHNYMEHMTAMFRKVNGA